MTYHYCNSQATKQQKFREFREQLKVVAELMGLNKNHYDIRVCKGGPAVWGEVILHTDRVYIQVQHKYELGILVRACRSRKDFTGFTNHWAPMAWINSPVKLVEFAQKVLRAESLNWVRHNVRCQACGNAGAGRATVCCKLPHIEGGINTLAELEALAAAKSVSLAEAA